MHAPSTNQAILLTGPGAAAIAVIRVQGPAVPDFLHTHFRARPRLGSCVHGRLTDGDKTLDDPVVVLTAPHRADLNLHGGPWVVRSVLQLLGRAGFQVIQRAAADHTDLADGAALLDRQVHRALPQARTELALSVLLAQPAAWRTLSQQLQTMDAAARRQRLQQVLDDPALENLLRLPQVALVGPPNVGKSTLANALFAVERSITADLPGTTRDWVGETANLQGLPVLLVDTPGVRDTHDPIEQDAIARSTVKIAGVDLLLLVLDATRPLQGEQQALLDRFPGAIRLVNKMDAANGLDPDHIRALGISAIHKQGLDQLTEKIHRHFGCWQLQPELPRPWRPEHRPLLQAAIDDPQVLARALEPSI